MPRIDHSETYDVRDFSNCRNTEKGDVFIIASGASAKNFPIERYSHIPMITMNGAISAFFGKDVQPYFYVCSDRSFSSQQPDLFTGAMAISQRVALWADQELSADQNPTGEIYPLLKPSKYSALSYFFRDNNNQVRSHSLFSSRKKSIGFSKNMAQGFFDARTVAYLALQIAYHLGFNKVYLVGVDLNERAGRFYENKNSKSSPCGLEQHLESRILPSFRLMAEKIISDEFKVYNLSNQSAIPESIIPRMSIDEISKKLRPN